MRRRYINFRPICQARRLPRRPVSSNWPAATPTGHFLSGPSSGPSARHVLVRPNVISSFHICARCLGLHDNESTVAISIDKVQVLLSTLPVLYIELAQRKNHADTSHHRKITRGF